MSLDFALDLDTGDLRESARLVLVMAALSRAGGAAFLADRLIERAASELEDAARLAAHLRREGPT